MRRLAAVVVLSLALPAYPETLAIDRSAGAIKGMEARFTHRFTPRGFKTSQTESGSVTFGTLPMMRWSYEKPEQKLFVFDGNRSWFYVPSDKQVTVADLDEKRRAELPFLFLGDPAARERHFVVRQQRRGSTFTTTLKPRAASAAIRDVTIVTDARSNVIDSVDYVDRDGNRTTFAFSGYHPAQTTADTFRFAPPAGVQVIRAE